MTDDRKKTDWSRLKDTSQARNLPEISPVGRELVDQTKSTSVGGVLQRLKEGHVKRTAAIKELQLVTASQIDVLTHQLQEAGKVKKTEASVAADKFLKELDQQFQEVIQGLGVRNEALRRETAMKLADETSRDLAEILNKDWPQYMKDETIEKIKTRWQGFLGSLMTDTDVTTKE